MMTQTQELQKETTGQKINASTLKQWLEVPASILLIDVRESGEYATEHIKGAILHPLSGFNPSEIKPKPGQKLVLYCQSGRRSAQAVQKLQTAGFTEIYQLENGLGTWKSNNYSLEKSQNAPISLMRQVQIVAGSLVTLGIILHLTIAPWGIFLSGFVGLGLIFAGVTNTCAMGMLLAKLPYNQR